MFQSFTGWIPSIGDMFMNLFVLLVFFCLWIGMLVYSRTESSATVVVAVCFAVSVVAFTAFVLSFEETLPI